MRAGQMMSFFFIQFSLMYMESLIGVKKWSPTMQVLWTLLGLFGPSYMLTQPVFALFKLKI